MLNFDFCNLDFGIDLTFGFWDLSFMTASQRKKLLLFTLLVFLNLSHLVYLEEGK